MGWRLVDSMSYQVPGTASSSDSRLGSHSYPVPGIYYWLNCTPTCSVAMLVLWKFMFLWRSTKEVKMLCPTRFVVDATENSKKGGVAAKGCSSQTGLWSCTLLRDIYARIRTYYVQDQIHPTKKKNTHTHSPEVRSRDGHVEHICKSSGSIC